MFTLIRPVAAILLAIFAYFAARAYEPLYDPHPDVLGNFAVWTAGMGFVVGWVFVGGRIGRALWFSIYIALQGVILTGIFIAMLMGVREIFILGYRRRYTEVMEAFTGYFDVISGWLRKALVQDYLILLGIGGLVLGIVLHIVWAGMERRRNDR